MSAAVLVAAILLALVGARFHNDLALWAGLTVALMAAVNNALLREQERWQAHAEDEAP